MTNSTLIATFYKKDQETPYGEQDMIEKQILTWMNENVAVDDYIWLDLFGAECPGYHVSQSCGIKFKHEVDLITFKLRFSL